VQSSYPKILKVSTVDILKVNFSSELTFENFYLRIQRPRLECRQLHPSCCNVLQCVAVCCSVLQCVAVCCSVSHFIGMHATDVMVSFRRMCVAVCCSVLECVGVCWSALQCVALCCSVLQCAAVCCSVLQFVRENRPKCVKTNLYVKTDL